MNLQKFFVRETKREVFAERLGSRPQVRSAAPPSEFLSYSTLEPSNPTEFSAGISLVSDAIDMDVMRVASSVT